MNPKPSPRTHRQHIGIHHRCCNVYARVYLNEARSAFIGKCPKCGRQVQLRAGSSGSKQRLWTTD